MERIDVHTFISKIKESNVICSTEYGYALFIKKHNPYIHFDFDTSPNAEFFVHNSPFGTLLKLTINKKVQLIAFSICNAVNKDVISHDEDGD